MNTSATLLEMELLPATPMSDEHIILIFLQFEKQTQQPTQNTATPAPLFKNHMPRS